MVHVPVMLEEVLGFLEPPRPESLMLDCTLGEGGHAEAFLGRYPGLRYLGLDADPEIQAKARERLAPFAGRVEFRLGYFDELLAAMGEGGEPAPRPDLVLFDLGVSMHHFVEAGRGFAYSSDEPLDMRLSPEAPRSAAELLAEEGEEEIARVIFEYGEERLSRRIARAIVEARRSGPVATSGRLAELVRAAVPPSYRHGRIHPATRTFQALRIAVNDELGRAERGIARAAGLLAPGGTMAVISFHSLEDRIVKRLFRALAGKAIPGSIPGPAEPIPQVGGAGSFELVTKKPVEPSGEEAARNPASRSAKLRVIRKLGDDVAAGPAGAGRR
ncbi:MAG TPA: 16S rRNA (cytosine(1402)-N(4))-methyltransferase RsmH [Spirochaetales bacterium]|nr:16S rRNA (cytosine(1402)-N(4))-methyltransferase RsmH [Spirochaetales bacterium]